MADPATAQHADALAQEFLRIARHQLRERLQRIEVCLDKLSPEQVWHREHETENAAGNLVIHLAGNLRQWIVSGVGGAPDERHRDAEFAERRPLDKREILQRLREAVNEADAVLAGLTAGDLLGRRKIQVYEVTVLHAVHHVVEHFAEHTGQIIWAVKRMTGQDLGFYSYLKTGTRPEGAGP